jgi:hypothetical protein
MAPTRDDGLLLEFSDRPFSSIGKTSVVFSYDRLELELEGFETIKNSSFVIERFPPNG